MKWIVSFIVSVTILQCYCDKFEQSYCGYGYVSCIQGCTLLRYSNCAAAAGGVCTYCQDGAFMDEDGICQPCSLRNPGCTSCTYSTTTGIFRCRSSSDCKPGYVFTSNYLCEKIPNCLRVDHISQTCVECEIGYYYDSTIVACVKVRGCADCEYYLSCPSYQCGMDCQPNMNAFTECVKTPPTPYNMSRYSMCSRQVYMFQDAPKYMKIVPVLGETYSNCEGYNTCDSCENDPTCCTYIGNCLFDIGNSKCNNCGSASTYDGSLSDCRTCGYFYGDDSKCYETCNRADNFKNYSDCIACGFIWHDNMCKQDCDLDVIYTRSDCRTCKGFFNSQTHKCQSSCPPPSALAFDECSQCGYHWNHDKEECVQSIPNCVYYQLDYGCTYCEEGYILSKGMCVKNTDENCQQFGNNICDRCEREGRVLDSCGQCPEDDDYEEILVERPPGYY